jgi:hypothetical protein
MGCQSPANSCGVGLRVAFAAKPDDRERAGVVWVMPFEHGVVAAPLALAWAIDEAE